MKHLLEYLPRLSNQDVFWISVIVSIPVALLTRYGWKLLRVASLIGRTPVVPIGSAAEGVVAIEGIAEAIKGRLFVAPLTGASCVWYRSMLEHLETGGKGSIRWSKAGGSQSFEPFLVRDGSGACAVYAHGKDVVPTDFSAWFGTSRAPKDRNPPRHPGSVPVSEIHAKLSGSQGTFRYLEQRIYPGDRVFVLGRFTRNPPDSSSADDDEDDSHDIGPGGWPGFDRRRYREAVREALGVTPNRIAESGRKGEVMVVSGVPKAQARGLYLLRSKGMFLFVGILASIILAMNGVHFLL